MIVRAVILVVAFAGLAAQEPLQKFIDEMEKLYAGGADPKSLADAIDRHCQKQPLDVKARLAWNKALFLSRSRVLAAFIEYMKGKIGTKVDVGEPPRQQTGKLLEVKEDRLVLEIQGGRMEMPFLNLTLAYQNRTSRKSPTPTEDDCVATGSTGNIGSAAEALAKIEDADAKARAADALAGLALQRLDGHVQAKRFDKAYGELTSPWMKQEALLQASEGALKAYSGETYPKLLLFQAEDLAKKDKKGARKLLDQAMALVQDAELRLKVVAGVWAAMSSGEWLSITIDESLQLFQGEVENGRITGEDPTTEANMSRQTKIQVPGIPIEEVVGLRGKLSPGTANAVGFRLVQNAATQAGPAITVDLKLGTVTHSQHPDKGPPAGLATQPIVKKAEYDVSIDALGGKVRSMVDGKEVYSGVCDKKPCEELWFVKNDGKASVVSLALRKK